MDLDELIAKLVEIQRDHGTCEVIDGDDRELVAVEFNDDEGSAVVLEFE